MIRNRALPMSFASPKNKKVVSKTMAYTLQAILAAHGAFSGKTLPKGFRIVHLRCGLEMLPLASELRAVQRIPFFPLIDGNGAEVPVTLLSLFESLGAQSPLAYVEAEYFGGEGTQAHALISEGKLIRPPVVSSSAINGALLYLGVTKGEFRDEFEAAGLDAHRDTDQWLA